MQTLSSTIQHDPAAIRQGSRANREHLRMLACRGCGAANFVPHDLIPLATVSCGRCHDPLLIPMRLRQYELHTVIGTGGMGTAYQATDLILRREVAVKLIHGVDPATLENFRREARVCAALNHTNIISIYSFEEFAGQSCLIMELADGGSLQRRIEAEQRLPELEVLDLGVKVASALAAALKQNLLHRDIKPGNLLFNADREPKLVDFGLARAAVSDEEKASTLWATPYYVAPEKAKGEPESFSSDLYSLAATLYHALTGHAPFEATTVEEVLQAHAHTPLIPPRDVVDEITQPTSDALVRAMAKSPADRYQTYDEFIIALTAARSQLLVEKFTRQPYPANRHTNGKNSKRWWSFD